MNAAIPRIALVTGAGSGIGRAASEALAEAGFTVVLAGRRAEPLHELHNSLLARGLAAMTMPADVTDPAAVVRLFLGIREQYGRLDLLFNNAGTVTPRCPLEDLAVADFQSLMSVNVTGAFLCTQQAVRLMKAQHPRGGRIINNGSISAHTPRPHQAAYAISKHAITGLTRATALEGRAFDIACGQIDIGNAQTVIGSHVTTGALQANGSTAVEPMIPLQQVAGAIAYMAGLPLGANVLSMTVMATGMPFVGRG